MVPPWGMGSSSRGRTHGKNVLSGGSRTRHGDGSSGGHGSGDSGGCRCSDGGTRAWVGAAGRGRRSLPHFGPEAVSTACLHHGWAGERDEEDRRKRGFRNDFGMKRGVGVSNRWTRAVEEVKPN